MNTNKNSYTLIYATVMVVIVALMLALVSSALKEKQNANVRLDKMKQILASLNVSTDGQDAEQVFNQYIKQQLVVNANAEIVESPAVPAFDIEVKKELSLPLEKRNLPLYVAEVDGQTKYIISLFGTGLWGPIWGYISLDADKNTVYGVNFSHASETPGLGSNIVDKDFTDRFLKPVRRQIFDDKNTFVSILVQKKSDRDPNNDLHEIDAISGGTITSKGVEKMLFDCIGQYETYLKQK